MTPSTVIEGSTDNYVTFTYTAAAGGVNDGSISNAAPWAVVNGTPEPGSIALLGATAMSGLGFLRRRRPL